MIAAAVDRARAESTAAAAHQSGTRLDDAARHPTIKPRRLATAQVPPTDTALPMTATLRLHGVTARQKTTVHAGSSIVVPHRRHATVIVAAATITASSALLRLKGWTRAPTQHPITDRRPRGGNGATIGILRTMSRRQSGKSRGTAQKTAVEVGPRKPNSSVRRRKKRKIRRKTRRSES